ncbi:hypothetical protein [Actinoplanes italicus]|uniref:hypothetical protein n=1 Tax=Actinoplanes italicus TaxID=113567 RepID=UPI000D083C1A|nr:hypothetical protein [Actinoplanes italicus]
MDDSAERPSVLILRAWREGPDEVRVRAIAVTPHASREVATAASVNDACAVVRRWLEELGDG